MRAPLTAIDAYLTAVPSEKRRTLEALRRTIRSLVPKAEECISYRLPAFRLGGTVIAGFSVTAKGFSYYPFSGSTLRTLADDLGGYAQTKSALHFSVEKPLPTTLVRKLIRARLAETAARSSGRAQSTRHRTRSRDDSL